MATIDSQLLRACQDAPQAAQRVVVTLHAPASAARSAELRQHGLAPVPYQDTIFQGKISCDSISKLGASEEVLEIAADREMKAL